MIERALITFKKSGKYDPFPGDEFSIGGKKNSYNSEDTTEEPEQN